MTPKVWLEDKTLNSRTSLIHQIICLFSYLRTVEVDGKLRRIDISTRWLWWIKSEKTIPFDRIDTIDTKYDESTLKDSRYETYQIVLSLKNPREKYRLISFTGSVSRYSGGNAKSINDFHSYIDELRRLVGS